MRKSHADACGAAAETGRLLFFATCHYCLIHTPLPAPSPIQLSSAASPYHPTPFPVSAVKRLASLGMVPELKGMAALDMNAAEAQVVQHTREIVPGMVVAGMEVATLDQCPRMGPTFGAMFMSGVKSAHVARNVLDKLNRQQGEAKKGQDAGKPALV